MKKHILNYILSSLILGIAIVSFSGCGSGGGEEDVVLKRLTSGPWKVKSVTVDGVNKDALFTGLTLTFTATGYTATDGEPVWPSSGTWVFADAEKKVVRRNDDIDISIDDLTDNSLTLSLNWGKTTFGSGRAKSVSGAHVFEFIK